MMYSLQSCSTEKRAQRHLKKAIKLDPTIKKKDTIIINDTLISTEVRKDTIINLERLTDTFFLEKDKLSLKLIKVHDSVYIDAKCDADTIYYTKEIPVERLIYKNYPNSIQKIIDYWYLFLLGVLTFLYLIAKILKK